MRTPDEALEISQIDGVIFLTLFFLISNNNLSNQLPIHLSKFYAIFRQKSGSFVIQIAFNRSGLTFYHAPFLKSLKNSIKM